MEEHLLSACRVQNGIPGGRPVSMEGAPWLYHITAKRGPPEHRAALPSLHFRQDAFTSLVVKKDVTGNSELLSINIRT